MENMHCATAFQAMQEEGHDVLAPLGSQVRRDVLECSLNAFESSRVFKGMLFDAQFVHVRSHLLMLSFPGSRRRGKMFVTR
jgi:hypothetical protein